MTAVEGRRRVIKARGVYMWQANHLWSVEGLIPEGRVSKQETAVSHTGLRRSVELNSLETSFAIWVVGKMQTWKEGKIISQNQQWLRHGWQRIGKIEGNGGMMEEESQLRKERRLARNLISGCLGWGGCFTRRVQLLFLSGIWQISSLIVSYIVHSCHHANYTKATNWFIDNCYPFYAVQLCMFHLKSCTNFLAFS